ncbi:hypothetical protein NA57DRAFT_75611 [Rhizodiscina lignyota]|uniref:UBA domain-containing protein n=1 Tax=Rhizodiscina lignyota TaxID=1504668 RepID=A0A9P4IFQ2_9PEZI|nr:hypothetical protein NA57DRAFT_75611 [Rhizodiscina lignyota]
MANCSLQFVFLSLSNLLGRELTSDKQHAPRFQALSASQWRFYSLPVVRPLAMNGALSGERGAKERHILQIDELHDQSRLLNTGKDGYSWSKNSHVGEERTIDRQRAPVGFRRTNLRESVDKSFGSTASHKEKDHANQRRDESDSVSWDNFDNDFLEDFIPGVNSTDARLPPTDSAASATSTDHPSPTNEPALVGTVSSRTRQRQRPSPSTHLINALRLTDNHHVLPLATTRQDLSYRNARKANALPIEGHRPSELHFQVRDSRRTISLQSILAKHIMSMHSNELSNNPIDFMSLPHYLKHESFSDEETRYLECRGYLVDDLSRWAAVLVAKNLPKALESFSGSSENDMSKTHQRLPLFLFLFLLRRVHVNALSLQLLLKHAWAILGASSPATTDKRSSYEAGKDDSFHQDALSEFEINETLHNETSISDQTVFIMFVRLSRHARKVWPSALINISSIVATYLRQHHSSAGLFAEQAAERASRLTLFYNRALSLLAFPASIRPFASSIFQEQAQFNLLRAMTEQLPPLAVTQEGYRGVARVQLARNKTDRERDWSSLQAKSWPPWKENRTGLDEGKDLEYGLSRAGHSIRRMMEAGYADESWENVARLFTGWDTDQSPTVQTRHLLPTNEQKEEMLWAARITTTRTAREAWACFESFKDSGAPPSEIVYREMVKRLLLVHKTTLKAITQKEIKTTESAREQDLDEELRGQDADEEEYTEWKPFAALPGEAIEPFPDPISPQELTYTRTDPPGPDALFQRMLDEGIDPSGQTRAILAKHANSVEQAVRFLEANSALGKREAEILLSSNEEDIADLQQLPLSRFSAFVSVLSRFQSCPVYFGASRSHEYQRWSHILPGWSLRWDSLAVHALRLVMIRKPIHRKPWYNVLRALAHPGVRIVHLAPGSVVGTNTLVAWKLMRSILSAMQSTGVGLDTEGFRYISNGIENAALSSLIIQSKGGEEGWRKYEKEKAHRQHLKDAGFTTSKRSLSSSTFAEANQVLDKSSQFLRVLFQSIVFGSRRGDNGMNPSAQPRPDLPYIPHLLSIPNSAELHAFVRALGMLGDHEGIWSLVQWMVENKDDLWIQVKEEINGRTRWRRLLTAIRVFLEYPHLDTRVREFKVPSEMKPASPDLMALVRAKLMSIEEWGGWPTAQEVRKYVWTGLRQDPPQKNATVWKVISMNKS